jgi:hypothetical protein
VINLEQTKQEIQGADVTITSWLDPQTHDWWALAYIHMRHKWPPTVMQGNTRIQAMKKSSHGL